jgi:hypothetical protein
MGGETAGTGGAEATGAGRSGASGVASGGAAGSAGAGAALAGSGGANGASAGAAAGGLGAGAGVSGAGRSSGFGGAGGDAGSAGQIMSAGAGSASSGGAGAGSANSGGNPGTAGASGSSGAAGSTSNGGVGAAGGATSCASGAHSICEDFENTAEGAVPTGWEKVGNVGAATDAAHRGTQSLKIGAATNGARRMRLTGSRVEALGGTHWGRIFYKVETPAPVPTSGVIHSTIVAWDAMSPVSGNNEVRVVDTVEDSQGRHQYLFNVQTESRGEFGKGSSYDFSYDGAWYCTEWHVDYSTQLYRFFLDGEELDSIGIMNGAGNFQNSELPSVFTALSVGWNNYQQAPSPGFVAWIDDLAIGSERIGCD